jgi:hypothetical protein
MTQYDVLAIAVDRDGNLLGEPRTERVSTDNPIFAKATGPWDVEDRYHAFWNRLNDPWEYEDRDEKVLVVSVTKVQP